MDLEGDLEGVMGRVLVQDLEGVPGEETGRVLARDLEQVLVGVLHF